MMRLDPLVEELEQDVEECLKNYRNAGGSPERVMAWWVDYLKHMMKAQPQKLRDEIKSIVHQRICEMD